VPAASKRISRNASFTSSANKPFISTTETRSLSSAFSKCFDQNAPLLRLLPFTIMSGIPVQEVFHRDGERPAGTQGAGDFFSQRSLAHVHSAGELIGVGRELP